MFGRFAAFVDEHALMPADTVGLIAFSGGPDSLCLLDLCAELARARRLTLLALHVDHGLRPESAAEAEEARALAGELGVAFATERIRSLERHRGNLQERAREARARALRHVARGCGAQWVATGHTADDQAETVLMRALRGAGPRGLGGIAPRAGEFVRPLLFARRSDVEQQLAKRGLRALRDPSNTQDHYARNRLRHGLLPLMSRENPKIVESLCRLAENCRADDAALDSLAERLLQRSRRPNGIDAEGIDLCVLRGEPVGLVHRVLVRAYEHARGDRRGLTRHHVLQLAELASRAASGTRRLDLPGVVAERRYDTLTIWRRDASVVERRDSTFAAEVASPGTWALGSRGAALSLRVGEELVSGHLGLPMSRLNFPLTVRSPRPGDRIAVGPLQQRRVSRVLIDAKIPRDERPAALLVVVANEIALIVGIRRAWGWTPRSGEPVAHFALISCGAGPLEGG